jgi:hypothetical protein
MERKRRGREERSGRKERPGDYLYNIVVQTIISKNIHKMYIKD